MPWWMIIATIITVTAALLSIPTYIFTIYDRITNRPKATPIAKDDTRLGSGESRTTRLIHRIIRWRFNRYVPYILLPLMIFLVLFMGTPGSRSMILFVSLFMALLIANGIGDLLLLAIKLWNEDQKMTTDHIYALMAQLRQRLDSDNVHNVEWHNEDREHIADLLMRLDKINPPDGPKDDEPSNG